MSKPFFYRVDAGQFLAEMARITDDSERGKYVLKIAFDLVDGKGNFPYSKQLIAEAKQFSRKKSEAGKKGMKNRWLHDNTAITKDNSDITNNNTDITRSSNRKPKSKKLEMSEEFLTFWDAYPRAVNKQGACEIWNRINPPINEVMDALKWQKESEQWREEKYIPIPTTYLNQKRWQDRKPQQHHIGRTAWEQDVLRAM